MRVLMVTPYPPLRDGIANYAVQAVLARRREGDVVTVLSPGPSAAHLHLDLAGVRGAAALARRVRDYDELVVQYHPVFFYDSGASARRSATDLALAAAFRLAPRAVAVLHEVEYAEFEADASRRRAATVLWRSLDELHFHSEVERARFLALFPVEESRTRVVAHGETFVRRTQADRAQARASLGLPADGTVFLSIGFIQRHKGFDRAVRAFAGLDASGAGCTSSAPPGSTSRSSWSTCASSRTSRPPRPAPTCTPGTSPTSSSTAGWSPATSWCCPTARSGPPACWSAPRSTAGRSSPPGSGAWPTRPVTAR